MEGGEQWQCVGIIEMQLRAEKKRKKWRTQLCRPFPRFEIEVIVLRRETDDRWDQPISSPDR